MNIADVDMTHVQTAVGTIYDVSMTMTMSEIQSVYDVTMEHVETLIWEAGD